MTTDLNMYIALGALAAAVVNGAFLVRAWRKNDRLTEENLRLRAEAERLLSRNLSALKTKHEAQRQLCELIAKSPGSPEAQRASDDYLKMYPDSSATKETP